MAFIERVMGLQEPKIALHALSAMLAERKRGRVTNNQVTAGFGLDAGERTELLALWGRLNSDALTATEADDVLMLAEHGIAPYDTAAAVRTRLGI